MDLIHVYHGERNMSKILCRTKVTDLELFMLNFYFVSFCKAFEGLAWNTQK